VPNNVDSNVGVLGYINGSMEGHILVRGAQDLSLHKAAVSSRTVIA
jgi:hypothetical protein